MNAIVYTRYGSPAMLRLEDVPKPAPKDNEVLVRVQTSSINAWDWDLLRGRPYLTRLGVGFRSPKRPIIGADVAGRVESVGPGVSEFAPGDAVYGDLSGAGWGGFAEYVSVRQSALAHIPAGVSFTHAAAIPQASVLALQALRKAPISTGQHVLIIGAGGGSGTFAVQMAKNSGAQITAVDRADKLDMLRSLGADHTLDYTREDFTKTGQTYDLIVDMVMNRSLFKYWRALAPNGSFVVVGGATGRIGQTVTLGPVLSRISGKKMGLLIHRPNRKDLDTVGEMVASGAVTPVIDRTYPLADLPDAFRYFGASNVKGKVVISVERH